MRKAKDGYIRFRFTRNNENRMTTVILFFAMSQRHEERQEAFSELHRKMFIPENIFLIIKDGFNR